PGCPAALFLALAGGSEVVAQLHLGQVDVDIIHFKAAVLTAQREAVVEAVLHAQAIDRVRAVGVGAHSAELGFGVPVVEADPAIAGEIRGERQRADSGERDGVGLEPAVDAVDAVLDLAEVGVAQFKAEVAGRLIAAEHLVSGVVFIDRPFVDHGLAHAHAGVEAGRLGRLGAEGGGAKRQCQKGGGYGVGLAHAVAPDCRRPEGEGMERHGPQWRCATAALRPYLASPACNAKRARQYPAFRKWNVAMPRSMTAPRAGRTRTLRAAALVIATVLLAACASAPQRNPIALWEGSPNHSTRWARAIVLHHTAMDSAEGAIRTLQTANSGGPVSAHYLVGEDGRVHQLVAD